MRDFSYMRQSCPAFWFMQCTVKQSLWPGGWKKRTCLQTVTKQLYLHINYNKVILML